MEPKVAEEIRSDATGLRDPSGLANNESQRDVEVLKRELAEQQMSMAQKECSLKMMEQANRELQERLELSEARVGEQEQVLRVNEEALADMEAANGEMHGILEVVRLKAAEQEMNLLNSERAVALMKQEQTGTKCNGPNEEDGASEQASQCAEQNAAHLEHKLKQSECTLSAMEEANSELQAKLDVALSKIAEQDETSGDNLSAMEAANGELLTAMEEINTELRTKLEAAQALNARAQP